MLNFPKIFLFHFKTEFVQAHSVYNVYPMDLSIYINIYQRNRTYKFLNLLKRLYDQLIFEPRTRARLVQSKVYVSVAFFCLLCPIDGVLRYYIYIYLFMNVDLSCCYVHIYNFHTYHHSDKNSSIPSNTLFNI